MEFRLSGAEACVGDAARLLEADGGGEWGRWLSGEAMQDAPRRGSRLWPSVELSGTHDAVGCEGVMSPNLEITVSRVRADWQHCLNATMTRTTRTRILRLTTTATTIVSRNTTTTPATSFSTSSIAMPIQYSYIRRHLHSVVQHGVKSSRYME